jgi:molybdopterin/thiamine biosynthesis adenylyltransferase
MSTLRFTDPAHWDAVENHLADASAERFVFALTRSLTDGADGPVLQVSDVELVHDGEVERELTGSTIADAALDRVHNRAITEQRGLVEFHSHRHGPPGFSRTDEAALHPMAKYVVDLLDGRPYGAAVWADGTVRADWFRPADGAIQRGTFRSVTVVGDRLRLLNARDIDEERFNRQIPMLTRAGQSALRGLRVAIVGGGGTGSHAITLLAYLGIRDFLLLDDDVIETTNLNRVVTAEAADIDAPKTLVAKRRILALDPDATVQTMPGLTPFGEHPELLEVDLVVGCVDHDGPRHRLNELAVDAGVPYIDIGTGVDANIDPPATGARVAFVLPGGPCLGCTDELDPTEVARWYKPAEQQNLDRAHGYGTGTAVPSVVHLNGLAVNAAVAEIVTWITGARPPARRLDINLNGDPALPGTRVAPSSDTTRRSGCVVCSWRYPSLPGTSAA